MSDDLEQMLRNSLAAHARQAPTAPDLSEPVIARGRTIRRRRRVVGATTAALAVVAVTGAVVQLAGPGAHEEVMPAASGPSAIASVQPRAELTSAGVVIRTGGRSVPLPADVHSVLDVAPAGGSVVVLASTGSTASAPGTQQLLVVPASGAAREIATGAIGSMAVSPDGAKVAYVGAVAGAGEQVRVRSVADGQLLGSTSALDGARAVAWEGGAVVVAEPGRRVTTWTPGGAAASVPLALDAYRVPGTAQQLYRVTSDTPGMTCVRQGQGIDFACAGENAAIAVSALPDGKRVLTHTTKPEMQGAQTAVTDLATTRSVAVPVDEALAKRLDWDHVRWTAKGMPLLRDGEGWVSIDLTTGAVARQSLPAGSTQALRW